MSSQPEHGPVRTAHADVLLASAGERGVLREFYGEQAADDLMLQADGAVEAREMAARIRPGSGPVLELAAGTGRLTFPFLELGFEVTALELSPALVDTLGKQVADAPADLRDRCTVVQGDMSAFALDRRFGSAIISYGSISLLDDADRPGLYASVRAHLEPGGKFLICMINTGRPESPERRQELAGRSGRRYVLHLMRYPAEQVQEITIYPADTTSDPFVVCTSRLKLLEAEQVVRELEQAGFDVLAPTPFSSAGEGGRQDALLLEASLRGDRP
ncbi:daptide-type RiPP biosynthesis methyltransferase [Amycolatopsis samaneae]|uniref:Daptide-type RiPP biosynthesis methyltransferase n=1 Tax=Amycolatopsis samaneae TaxID=664691 RepID=A0ABW5GT50_9PSEU